MKKTNMIKWFMKTAALLMCVILAVPADIGHPAEADVAEASVVLGIPTYDNDIIRFTEAVITNDSSINSITVNVDKGSIASDDFTTADVLAQHKTATWKFSPAKSAAQATEFLRGVKFNFAIGMEVSVTVDSNPSSTMPAGATLTAFTGHEDGKTHYYMYVISSADWITAYGLAKTYVYMGLRGYLATITQIEEDKIIDNLTLDGAWAGGARVSNSVTQFDCATADSYSTASSSRWLWTCGPEAGQLIHLRTMSEASKCKASGVVGASTGYSNWGSGQPDGTGTGEWNMQVHFGNTGEHMSQGAGYAWNDLPTNYPSLAKGYIVEFSEYDGGTVEGYSATGTVCVSQTVDHYHVWRYLVEDNCIKAICTCVGDFSCIHDEEVITTELEMTEGPSSGTYTTIEKDDKWDDIEDTPSTTITYKKYPNDEAEATTTKPTEPGTYIAILTVEDEYGHEISVSQVFTVTEDNQVEPGEVIESANTEASYINREYGYIIYDPRDHVIDYAMDAADNEVRTTYLDMTAETVTTTMTVACYSTDGGKSWKKATLEQLNEALPKILNNMTKLRIADAYNEKAKKADTDATVLKFATITRRPATTKFTVNYYLCRDDYGLTNGQWCLTKDNRGVDMDEYEIGISTDGKNISDKGYGVWPAGGVWGTCGGVWVSDIPSSGKTGKEVYLYRKLAENDTPASKPAKITVTTVQKAPAVKVDYAKGSLKLKEGMSIYFGETLPTYVEGNEIFIPKLNAEASQYKDYVGHALLKLTKNEVKKALDISGYLTETRNLIQIWQGATAKKPATAIQKLRLAACAPQPTEPAQVVTIANGKATLNKGYEVYNTSTKKWSASIPSSKSSSDATYIVRVKSTVKSGKENDTTFCSGIPAKLTLVYGVYDETKNKKGYISATLGPVDE